MKRYFTLPLFALLCSCQSTPPVDDTFQQRFTRADANQDGKLSREEVSDFTVHNVFAARDTNKDGKLSLLEWSPDKDPTEVAGFKKQDHNKDGFLSLDEALQWGRTNQGWGEIMTAADRDGDGFISPAEAKAYIASKEGPVR